MGTRFQVYFTPRQGFFSPFPLGTMRYRSLMVFSLGPWSARIQPEFRVLRLTWDAHPGSRMTFAYGAFTLYGRLFQHRSTNHAVCNCPAYLRLGPVRSLNPDRATPAGFNTRSV